MTTVKVKELIEMLKQFDGNNLVQVYDNSLKVWTTKYKFEYVLENNEEE